MARSVNSKATRTCPEVTFRIEMQPSTSAQIEAGRRLFKKLVARAQLIIGEASSEETSSWKK